MKSCLKNSFAENGSAIVMTLLIMAALTLSMLMAINVAFNDSSIMKNSRAYLCDLYRAETGITVAEEEHAGSWLAADSDLFDLSKEDAAVIVNDFTITGPDGEPMPAMGSYSIARIEKAPAEDSPSKAFYALGHTAPMPAGSGCSAVKFEIRRYGILSTGSSEQGPGAGVTVEAGLYKVLNKF